MFDHTSFAKNTMFIISLPCKLCANIADIASVSPFDEAELLINPFQMFRVEDYFTLNLVPHVFVLTFLDHAFHTDCGMPLSAAAPGDTTTAFVKGMEVQVVGGKNQGRYVTHKPTGFEIDFTSEEHVDYGKPGGCLVSEVKGDWEPCEHAAGPAVERVKLEAASQQYFENGEFVAEYAKSSRTTCKHCNEKIQSGEFKLAKMVPSDRRETDP